MKEKNCKNCKHFEEGLRDGWGFCHKNRTMVYETSYCIRHERKAYKVKPRRLCDFCERGKHMESEEGEHDMRLVKLTPVTPIDLTNPNAEEIKLGKPFYAMFLHDPEYGDEAATFPIKFCPLCGRKLVGE